MGVNLPVRGMGEDAEAYLDRLVTELERVIDEEGGTDLPIYDGSGNTLLDSDGHYIRRSDGSLMVQPDIVQVDTQDIVDAAIATAKLADQAVEQTKIANLAVGTAQVADAAIVTAKIGALQVTTAKIDDLAVNDAKIANLNVGKLEAGNIGANNIYLGSGTNFELDGVNRRIRITDDNAVLRVEMGELGAGATDYGLDIYDSSGTLIVGANGLGVSVVGGTQITDGAITTAKLDADAVTADKIGAGEIVAGLLAADAVVAGNIAADAVVAGNIAADAVTATTIATNAISANAGHINDLSASDITAGTMTAGAIQGITITGGTVRTSSSGTRVELQGSSNAIRAYESGSLAFEVDLNSSLSPYTYVKGSTTVDLVFFDQNGSGGALLCDGSISTNDDVDLSGNLIIDNSVAAQSAGGDLVLNPGTGFGEVRIDGVGATTGNFSVGGALSKSSGSFRIQHPEPGKEAKELWHSFVESPTAGDNLYRFVTEADSHNATICLPLPSYWTYLNENPQVWVSAANSFGRAFGYVNEEDNCIYVRCEEPGAYNVLLIGTRRDPAAVKAWKGVERDV